LLAIVLLGDFGTLTSGKDHHFTVCDEFPAPIFLLDELKSCIWRIVTGGNLMSNRTGKVSWSKIQNAFSCSDTVGAA